MALMSSTGGSRGRSLLASIVGWLLVAVVVFLAFGLIVGTIRFLVRIAVVVVVVGGLAWLYFRLKDPD